MKIDTKFNPRKNVIGKTFGCWFVVRFSHRKISTNKGKNGYKLTRYYYIAKCLNCGVESLKTNCDFNEIQKENYKCRNCHGKEKGITGLAKLYDDYKRRSARFNRDFKLTLEEFKTLTSKNCFYCGSPPTQLKIIRPKKGYIKHTIWSDYYYNGIDRKNTKLGYTIDNCVACCIICNRAKNNISFDEFTKYIERIRQNG